MSDKWTSIENDLAACEKAIPDNDMRYYQKQVELHILLSIAKNLEEIRTHGITNYEVKV